MSEISTKPYLLRAIHEWCGDSGFTPYIAVAVDERTFVPADHVRAGEIVLNISLSATNRLTIGNELIEFQARFGGVAQDLSIPVENVSAIYARENGHGMAFEVAKPLAVPDDAGEASDHAHPGDTELNPAPDAVGGAPNQSENSRPSLAAVPKSKPLEAVGDTPQSDPDSADTTAGTDEDGDGESPPPAGKRRGKPKLTRVK